MGITRTACLFSSARSSYSPLLVLRGLQDKKDDEDAWRVLLELAKFPQVGQGRGGHARFSAWMVLTWLL